MFSRHDAAPRSQRGTASVSTNELKASAGIRARQPLRAYPTEPAPSRSRAPDGDPLQDEERLPAIPSEPSRAETNSSEVRGNHKVETCVPLSRASASFGAIDRVSMPSFASSSAEGTNFPSTTNSPIPIIDETKWASGARSPDAPTEPCAGTAGMRPSGIILAIACRV